MARMNAAWLTLCFTLLLCLGCGLSWADTPLQVTSNLAFLSGRQGDSTISADWHNAEGSQAFREGELRLVTAEGKRSLEINTLGKGAVSRKLYNVLEVDVNSVYEIAYAGKRLDGDGYVSISARQTLDDSRTSFLAAIGNVDLRDWRGKATFSKTKYSYNQHIFDCARPRLVLQMHGEARVVIDEISIRPVKHKGWLNENYQPMPWQRDWQRGVVSDEVVTPHTRWAKPYAEGEIKVTTVLPRLHHRWTVELSQRMSVAFRPVMLEANKTRSEGDYWIAGKQGDPEVFRYRQETVQGLSHPTDCLVLGYRSGSHITKDRVKAILDNVASGAGLVIIEPEADGGKAQEYREGEWAKALNDGNLWGGEMPDILPGTVVGAEATFYRHGAGRIALLSRLPVPGTEAGLRGEFEAQMSAIMKAVLWASNRMPPVRMSRFTLPGKQAGPRRAEVARGKLPSSMRVDFSAALPGKAVLRWWLDDYESLRHPGGEEALADGSESVQIALPVLPGGEHWLHMHLMSRDGRVLDWNTVALKIVSAPAIQHVALARDRSLSGFFIPGCYREGERLEGRVILEDRGEEETSLRLRLVDFDGHLWSEKTLPAAGEKEIAFALEMPKAVLLMHRLEVALVGPDGTDADVDTRHVVVTRSDDWYRNNFLLHNWGIGAPGGYLGLLDATERGRFHGVACSYRGDPRIGAYANIRTIPMTGRNQPGAGAVREGPANAPVRSRCPSAPMQRGLIGTYYIENSRDRLGRQLGMLPQALPYAPLGYEIAHEVNLLGYGALSPDGARADVCFCEYCLAGLRAMMQAEYGTLDALNQAWGTTFSTWEAVRPIVLDEAVKSGEVARWIDHRRHMDRVWTEAMKFKVDVVRRHDPEAWGVADGFRAPTSWSGVDYWLLGTEGATAGYGPSMFFAPPERRHLTFNMGHSLWARRDVTADDALYQRRIERQVWGGGLLAGVHGISRFLDYDINPHVGWFRHTISPDLRITEEGRWDADAVAHIRTGLDRLVFESRRNDSGIALLYSRSSEHAATAWHAVVGGGDLADRLLPSYRFSALALFSDALNALGYGYGIVSEQQVAEGVLKQRGTRVLILGFAQALDAMTVSAVKAFVADGGIVLADLRPAVADQHGRIGTSGLLDDVFGVVHTNGWGDYRPVEKALTLEGQAGDMKLDRISLQVMAGPHVRRGTAQGASAGDGTPVMLVNRYDRGRAVLFNFRPLQMDAEVVRLMGHVLEWAGLDPLFAVETIETKYPDYNRPSPRAVADAKRAIEGGEGDAAFYQPLDKGDVPENRPGLAHYRSGNTHVIGLWYAQRLGDGTRRVRVIPPTEGHIYDLLNNKYLGRHRQFEVEVPLESVRVYAVVPYRMESPVLKARAVRAEGGLPQIACEVSLSPRLAATEKTVVRMQLFAPDGSEWRDFNDNTVVDNSVSTYVFTLPLNAPHGAWTVKAREAISGLSASASVQGW